jgi:hypothetical protein
MTVPIILKDRYTAAIFFVGALLLVIALFRANVNFADADNLLVIHFDAYKGVDFFGDARDVFDIVISAAVVWGINIGLANMLYFRERLLSYLLATSTLIFAVLILISINVIININ